MRKYLLIIALSALLVSCSSGPNNNPNDSSHSKLSFQQAKRQGYVVVGPPGLANVNKLEKFYEDYLNKTSCLVALAHYTDEGDPIFIDLEFNGEEILYTYDNSWDGFGGQNKGVQHTTCTQMNKRTGPRGERKGTEYYLNSCNDDIGYSDPVQKEYFLMFIDDKEQ
ncbi:DUF4362 domain-containing protein [Paenibacillus lutimineralis]|uniref:DUF4362 domain-containing protein n=1 Tax=Paenibacillus lutimineralis TaxID=2707005 RepID=A0A3S9V1V4_9BACL|nr:DUF4362 domain-containing protein [Paenibacillus lutimineralis]AZS16548.1 DUF4362 domain-containing protein [Paenibacillus lutimineralis]